MLGGGVGKDVARGASYCATFFAGELPMQLAMCLEMVCKHGSGEPNRGASPRELFDALGAELSQLAWLNAVPVAGISSEFARRWSTLPMHCAVADRLAELVEWMVLEGAGMDEEDETV